MRTNDVKSQNVAELVSHKEMWGMRGRSDWTQVVVCGHRGD